MKDFFSKIEQQFPKAYSEFKAFFMEKYADASTAILPNFDLAIGNKVIQFKFSELYEFFDEKGVLVFLQPFDCGEMYPIIYIYENWGSTSDLQLEGHTEIYFNGSDYDNIDTNTFDSRFEANKAAFEKAFECLEGHI